METITSRQNPLMTHIRKLAGSAAYRRQTGECLCDSPKLLREAAQWGADVRTVVSVLPWDGPLPDHVRQVLVPPEVMSSISPAKTPQGVLFTCAIPVLPVPETLPGRRYVVLDGVQDPGNVGTVLRTLDAFDADGLLLTGGCADPFGPKTVRASMGAVFRRPVWSVTPEELGALLRRSGGLENQNNRITAGSLTVDTQERNVYKDGKPVELTAREFDLVELLIRNPNRVYSRENLLDLIWGYEYRSDIRTVDVHIRRIREKLETVPAEPEYIMTKWGVGYYFKA